MKFGSKQALSLALTFFLGVTCLSVQVAKADDHVVPLKELHDEAKSTSEQRTKNINDIERVLSYPAAAAALQKSNVNQDQMRRAVATLDDAELARLANQARASENDVKGGFIVGILALIGLIVVIIIVVAVVA
jgi:hypothetical protein